jgi:GNAT superfamily N-acetyltransferase
MNGAVRIRHARAADLPHIGPIEDAGAPMFREHFGPGMSPILEAKADDGWQRAEKDGFLLVATEGDGPPVGFTHVLVIDGQAHLEQVSVLPGHQRRGIASELVRAAMAEAAARGFDRMSLCTYRDVPWNGPFYTGLGFAEIDEAALAPYQARIRAKEREIGLDEDGVRIVMSVALR